MDSVFSVLKCFLESTKIVLRITELLSLYLKKLSLSEFCKWMWREYKLLLSLTKFMMKINEMVVQLHYTSTD